MTKISLISMVLIAGFFSSNSSQATVKNPLIRQCLLVGGQYLVAQSENDQIGLCQFNKSSIGALETMLFSTNDSILNSVKLYMREEKSCTGRIKSLTILGGSTIQFCNYIDNSWIDLDTLKRGIYSTENKQLNDFLGL